MWTQADEAPVASTELGPAARPDPTPADDLGRAGQLVADEHSALDARPRPRAPARSGRVRAYHARSKPRASEWYQARSWA